MVQHLHQFGRIFFFFLKYFLAFSDSTAEELDGKQGKRRGVTRSKGTRAGSRTRVRCRASAHGSRALPTELCGAQFDRNLTCKLCGNCVNRILLIFFCNRIAFHIHNLTIRLI